MALYQESGPLIVEAALYDQMDSDVFIDGSQYPTV